LVGVALNKSSKLYDDNLYGDMDILKFHRVPSRPAFVQCPLDGRQLLSRRRQSESPRLTVDDFLLIKILTVSSSRPTSKTTCTQKNKTKNQ